MPTFNDKYIFFWGGIYSQWLPCKFMIEGVQYNCTEQYMMAEKARLFGDIEAEKFIMASKSPAEQKAMGRAVRDFDVAKWEAVARDIVTKGNLAKFSQNENMKAELLDSGNKTIVEASPEDKIWGIGLSEFDDRCYNPEQWQGRNWLGECIMKARDVIRANEAAIESVS